MPWTIIPKHQKSFKCSSLARKNASNTCYLFQIQCPDGYVCSFCQASVHPWRLGDYKLKCQKCQKIHSLLKGTVFQGTHTPLHMWFRIMWHICLQKKRIQCFNRSEITRHLVSETAWLCLHKLRKAMVRAMTRVCFPEKSKLTNAMSAVSAKDLAAERRRKVNCLCGSRETSVAKDGAESFRADSITMHSKCFRENTLRSSKETTCHARFNCLH